MRIVSSFDFTDEVLADYVRRYERFRPTVVVGYTNALHEFARYCGRQGVSLRPPAGVIATAERLFPHQRQAIEAAFGASVFDRYGCREVMNIAAECDQHQGLHVNADNLYLELEQDGQPVSAGKLGEVLVTDLNNYAMPFIRYKNGDMAVAASSPCSCGRGLPLLEKVEGRVLDVISTPDGRYLPGEFFPHLLKDYDGIDRFQVYQDEDYAVTIRIVADEDFAPGSAEEIEGIARDALGDSLEVSVRLVQSIPKTEGGKLRVTVSEVRSD
jgi:phenylacetate-CoA ligase